MAGTVSYKVYLTKENALTSKPEVRRFGIDDEIQSNFQYLREKLQTIFPSVRGKRFTVSWKDCDGDNIVISSDEELQIALAETRGAQVRKFYMILYSDYEQQGTQATQVEEGVCHNGVTCDGCEKKVYGFRYKCIQCVDYDLCMKCEAQALHSEHCMLRMPVPLQWSSACSRRLARHLNKLSNSKDFPYKSSKCEPRSRQRGYNYSWMDLLSSYVQDVANVIPVPATEAAEEPVKQSHEKSADNKSQQESAPKSRKNSDSHIEFLKSIGEHIAQFLDPLGIDVNVQVKNDKAQNTTEGTNTNLPSTSNGDKYANLLIDKSTTKTAETDEEKPKEADNSSVKDQTKDSGSSSSNVNSNESPETFVLEKNTPEPEGWTLLNENDSPPTSSNSTPISSRAPSVADAPPAKAVSTPPKESSVTADKPLYPPLPKEGKIPYHTNPKIQRAVETMMEMGFSNEGGWLTHLMVTKDGDISKALDILAPIRR